MTTGLGWSVMAEEVRNWGGEGMKEFVCEKKEFVRDAEPDWEPKEVHEGGGYVLPGFLNK